MTGRILELCERELSRGDLTHGQRLSLRRFQRVCEYFRPVDEEILPDACSRYIGEREPLRRFVAESEREQFNAELRSAGTIRQHALQLFAAAALISSAGADAHSKYLHDGIQRADMTILNAFQTGGFALVRMVFLYEAERVTLS